MDKKELAQSQIIIGAIAILGFLISTIKISPFKFEAFFSLTNSLGFLFGLFAIITGYYNLKNKK